MEQIRIIIADIHLMVRDCLACALEMTCRHRVAAKTGSGRQLIAMVQDLEPDLVIMDPSLPEINGIEATRQILALYPGIKVIAVSGTAEKNHLIGMLSAGASAFLLKSCPFDELLKAINLVMAGQTYLCPGVTGLVVAHATSAPGQGQPQTLLSRLSKREREVLQLIAEGHKNKDIADKLYISKKTVQIHRANLKKKLNMNSTAALTRFAVCMGITSLDFITLPPPNTP